jgi:hypothetical protein
VQLLLVVAFLSPWYEIRLQRWVLHKVQGRCAHFFHTITPVEQLFDLDVTRFNMYIYYKVRRSCISSIRCHSLTLAGQYLPILNYPEGP